MWCRRVLRLTAGIALAAAAIVLPGCGGSSPVRTTTSRSSSARSSSSAATSPTTTAASSSSGAPPASTSSTTSAGSAPGALPGAPGPVGGGGALTVTPVVGGPRSVFRFSLRAPAPSGRHGQMELVYSLAVTGPQHAGCIGIHSATLVAARSGQQVAVAIGPTQLGGRWCVGSYTARADELERPSCTPGQVCPEFIRVLSQFGPARFRITG